MFNKMFRKIKNNKIKALSKVALVLSGMIGIGFASATFAATDLTLSSIASNVDTSVIALSQILSDVSLIAGIGFIMASFFKFHQHKLNPTQVPMSQGITLLLIGAGLTLFPTLLPTAKQAVFGSAEMNKTGGSQIKSLISGGTSASTS